MPSARGAESVRGAQIADVVEPSVVGPQRVARAGRKRSVLAVKHVVAFRLVIEQRDVGIVYAGPCD